jgi:hypothetical protein
LGLLLTYFFLVGWFWFLVFFEGQEIVLSQILVIRYSIVKILWLNSGFNRELSYISWLFETLAVGELSERKEKEKLKHTKKGSDLPRLKSTTISTVINNFCNLFPV